MNDITPGLLARIEEDFEYGLDGNRKIQSLVGKVRDGTATYAEGNEYAICVGEELARAYKLNLYSDALPDGRMYYNIANRILPPTLGKGYSNIRDILKEIQLAINRSAGLGLNAVVPILNQDRVDGLVNKVALADKFDDVAWVLQEPVVNFSQSIVDDFIKSNAEFQGKSGVSHKLIRTTVGNCCEWCRNLAGTYDYFSAPDDIYRRHQRCRCTIEYAVDGKSNIVHRGETKKK